MTKFKNVVVGLSGGVDSAVAALLLKNRSYNVQAVFMQNWDIADEQGKCSANEDYKDAAIVSNILNIPLVHINFVKHYWNEVFTNLVKDYEMGYTPNPDILCNKHIKFNYFLRYAMKHLNADAVVTGHYAKTSFGSYLEKFDPNKKVKLLRANCIQKDQTFFLSQVEEKSLRKIMFPLGDLMKSEVKQIAFDNNLTNVALKKESMGICFIGNRNFQSFISEYIDNKPGRFVDIDTNKVVGEHNGIHQWTIGQRSKLTGSSRPLYVAKKIVQNNTIYVADGWSHKMLFSDIFFTSESHWIGNKPQELVNGSVLECDFKFQHVEALRKCTVCETKNGLIVRLNNPLRAITAGQYAVFYRDNECLGSARITHPGPPIYFYFKYKINKHFKNDIDVEKYNDEIHLNHTQKTTDSGEHEQIERVQ